ncbi:MAG: tRNA 2-thiouridine(34) synthase MnmA [Clostridia bacterium]|nr:tRNA 2-thiouridine(34) synthase MnmA [Clostridia bacterium]
MENKVLIAMSGGVDSSACASIITGQMGLPAVGVTMKLLGNKENNDFNDAKQVCEKLGIEHLIYDLSEQFEEYVIKYFVNSYLAGETPNPCIECNKHLKFGELFKIADQLSCRYISTGHYARVEYNKNSGKYFLKKAVDHKKDQSYFLYALNQEQLSRVLFPIGDYSTKDEIRALAGKNALSNAQKPDSQDICFVENGKYIEFIENYTHSKQKPGNMILSDGTIVGKHKGLASYTVGQRRGLGVAYECPLYVCAKDISNNNLILGTLEQAYGTRCYVRDFNSDIYDFSLPRKVKAKIRSRHDEQSATAVLVDENTLLLEFDEAQKSFSGGQAAVLYEDEYVIGGGTIV